MSIRIKMTQQEAEEFDKLSEEDKQKFFEGVNLRRKHLMLKTAVASMFLVECFDELEEIGMLRHKLKQSGSKFNVELDKYIDQIFAINEDNSDSTEYLNVMIKRFNEVFEKPIEDEAEEK